MYCPNPVLKKLNKFILVSKQPRTGILKFVLITADSPDGYLRTSVKSNFSQYGELIGGRMEEVETSIGQKQFSRQTLEFS